MGIQKEEIMAQGKRERQMILHNHLMKEKQRLWNEVRVELFETLGEGLHTQYEIPQDIGEQGLIDLLSDTGLAVSDIRRQELTQIDEALGKLDAGRYGICEDCGEEIAEARLKVAPYAPCCVSCQEQREGPVTQPGVTL
jgi:DnaK suppressor protein